MTKATTSRAWILPLGVSALAAVGIASIGGTLTELGPWYRSLQQPGWAPPDAAFPIAWTLVLALWSLAAVETWRYLSTRREQETLIGLFALSGFFNVGWSLLFFRLQRPDWALAELVLLWLSILAMMLWCRSRSRVAPWLLLPYLLWVTLAGFLNLAVVRLNGPFG
ncbi:MAG: TspO/MBR family protein [Sandaracinobacteroides sp.]